MVSVTLNDIKYQIPVCFEELTTKQYQRIVAEWDMDKPIVERDYFALFNILAGTDFKDYHASAENEVTIWNAIRWVLEQDFQFGELPKVLKIKERTIVIPNDITKLSIGQNIHLKQLLAESKYMEERLSDAVAIYLQPLYDGTKFDEDRAKEIKTWIDEMPVYLIRPIGFFLLTHASRRGRITEFSLQRILNSLWQKLGGMLPRSLRSTDYYLSRT